MHNRRVKGGTNGRTRAGVVAAGLLIVLGGLCARHLLRTPAKSAAAPDAAAPKATPGAPPPAGQLGSPGAQQGQPPLRVEVDWNLTLTRDPFSSAVVFPPKPVVAPPPEPAQAEKVEELTRLVRRNIKLTGTFLGSHPVAILNAKMYHTGDRVEGFLVTEIGAREVTLEKDGVSIKLPEWEAGR
jgi:hypothetical protein